MKQGINFQKRQADEGEAADAASQVAQIRTFVNGIRPILNSGQKEKSEQVALLATTWKQTRLDHKKLTEFQKTYTPHQVCCACTPMTLLSFRLILSCSAS
jgi:hypothetical protein